MAEVVAVNRYAVRDAAAFDAAVVALADRVQRDGHPGVRSYDFYRITPDEGRAIVVYTGPEAWVGHHDIIMSWPELANLRAAADLAAVDLHGPMTAAMQGWIDRMGLGARLRHLGEPVAGFRRPGL
ncbi:MAG: hypothetical protein MUC82_17400 [Cypionkella sp.]|jgi:hypothetical protein|nr:hypothetical protein [Cypionkella sp.]